MTGRVGRDMGHKQWGYCQVNIANWTRLNDSTVANLPINITDSYNSGTTLVSPLSDITPWTLMPTPTPPTANLTAR